MSDNIPFEIQAEIMKRLPVKSLIQFRSVSKSWKSLIDSSAFIKSYSYHQTQHLLVSYVSLGGYERKYVSIVDDHTFPRQRVSLTVPLLPNQLNTYDIIGCSSGLLCLYADSTRKEMRRVVLWNPSIQRVVAKIVKITYGTNTRLEDIESVVEVFTLSLGAWRNPYGNLPRKSITLFGSQFVNGCLYWLAMDRITVDGGLKSYNLIISFDMTTEEFKEVNLPDDLADLPFGPFHTLSLSKVSGSLVVLENGVEDVWMMQDGVPKSFTKLFNVNVNAPPAQVSRFRGFRKTGVPIIEIVQHKLHGQLVVYEPYSKHVDELEIDGQMFTFSSVYPYMETLLMLDQPSLRVFGN